MHSYQHVFTPFTFGNVTVKNRIATPPMLSCLATHDGFVTREMIEFYQSFARGGAGIVTIGDSAVDFDYARGHFGQLNLGTDQIIGPLSALVEAIQKYGAKISIELDHSGRLSPPYVIGGKDPIGPSPIPTKGERMAAEAEGREVVRVKEMDQDMIEQVKENFAKAARRCMIAGFEMVTVHGGHGQLLSQFVSPLANKRSDRYGGSLENRARFVVEVLETIRKMVGDGLALEYRVSADEIAPGGMHEEETIEFLKIIEDHVDLFNVSVGGMIEEPRYITYMAQPIYFPHAYNVHRAEKIKNSLRVPVTCVGSIIDLAMADKIIAESKADIVAMGRAHIADPDIVNKTYHGKEKDVRPCLRCNVCGERPKDFLPVRCAVNPVIGRELEYRYMLPPMNKKNIVVIGGGPAGMEAAIVASFRGHKVTLYEKEKELGGSLIMAAALPFKVDMKRYLDWLVRQTLESEVQVKLSTEATIESVQTDKPDVLIFAAGAEPYIPDLPGIRKQNVVWAGNVDIGKIPAGESVVVAGAGLTGCETGLYLAQQGKKVTIIDVISEAEIAKDTTLVAKITLMEKLEQEGVEFRTEISLEDITDNGVMVANKSGDRFEIFAESVVLALGVKARHENVNAFQDLVKDIYMIGDCSKSRNLMAAIHDAFNVAMEI